MSLLADLARLLRQMDPMPPRVLADALAAGSLPARPHAEDADADPGSPAPVTTKTPAGEAVRSVEGSAGGSAKSGAGGPDSRVPAAADWTAGGDWPAIPAGPLPGPRSAGVAELLVLAESVPAVRSPGRRLRIGPAGGEPLLELEIRPLGATQRIAGLATANTPLTIRHEHGDHDVDVDDAGYFNVEIPAGPIRIRLHEAESGWI